VGYLIKLFKKKDLENKKFLDTSIEYLINHDDYYYFVELSFIDSDVKGPHDENKCFINYIIQTSPHNYSPQRINARWIN
jgi:hypothetical protein